MSAQRWSATLLTEHGPCIKPGKESVLVRHHYHKGVRGLPYELMHEWRCGKREVKLKLCGVYTLHSGFTPDLWSFSEGPAPTMKDGHGA